MTCVQFKPTNDNYFISGCIDGMVRIWDVPRCLVVDWADSKEIITAVCYRPDGKVHPNTFVMIKIYQFVFMLLNANSSYLCWSFRVQWLGQ